jgi:hypothetical protein
MSRPWSASRMIRCSCAGPADGFFRVLGYSAGMGARWKELRFFFRGPLGWAGAIIVVVGFLLFLFMLLVYVGLIVACLFRGACI